MGRELKRVPMDFDWALNKTWQGFINPHYRATKCQPCDGTGYSSFAKRYSDQWYGHYPFDPTEYGAVPLTLATPAFRDAIERKVRYNESTDGSRWYTRGGTISLQHAIELECIRMYEIDHCQWCHHLIQADVDALIEAERLHDLTHTWTKGDGWKPKDPMPAITAEQVNGWSFSGMGHDSINQWVCIKARCVRDGHASSCAQCNGDGELWPSDDAKQRYDDWEQEEPPTGDGYQIWETVPEGSPVTPVFATPEELADWLVANDTSITKDSTRDQWLAFIKGPGWAPSLVGIGGDLVSGVEAVGRTGD